MSDGNSVNELDSYITSEGLLPPASSLLPPPDVVDPKADLVNIREALLSIDYGSLEGVDDDGELYDDVLGENRWEGEGVGVGEGEKVRLGGGRRRRHNTTQHNTIQYAPLTHPSLRTLPLLPPPSAGEVCQLQVLRATDMGSTTVLRLPPQLLRP